MTSKYTQEINDADLPKAVILIPDGTDSLPFTEFFKLEYRSKTAFEGYKGVVIWHVAAELCETYENMLYYKYESGQIKYLRPVKEGYKTWPTTSMFVFDRTTDMYIEGMEFSPETTPSSDFYGDVYTGIYIKVLETTDDYVTIHAGFLDGDEYPDDPSPSPDPGPANPVIPPQPSPELPNDISGHWGETEIAAVIKAGLMQGYPDGMFNPDGNLTRGELAAILCRYLDIAPEGIPAYPDAKNHWASEYVAALAERGILKGYDDGFFRPDGAITREEIAVILDRALKPEDAASSPLYADDGEISTWARQGVYNAQSCGWLRGYPDGTFRPKGEATRAEIAAVFARLLG